MIDLLLLLFSISPVWFVWEDSDKGPAEEYSENTAKNTTELFLFFFWKSGSCCGANTQLTRAGKPQCDKFKKGI